MTIHMAYNEDASFNHITYAPPGERFDSRVKFKHESRHNLVLFYFPDPSAPALKINQINRWLGERNEIRAEWRTPRGQNFNLILVTVKNLDTALLFKLTFGGA